MAAAVLSHRCEDEQQNVGKLFLTTSFEGNPPILSLSYSYFRRTCSLFGMFITVRGFRFATHSHAVRNQ